MGGGWSGSFIEGGRGGLVNHHDHVGCGGIGECWHRALEEIMRRQWSPVHVTFVALNKGEMRGKCYHQGHEGQGRHGGGEVRLWDPGGNCETVRVSHPILC